jgi:hypothetical protein
MVKQHDPEAPCCPPYRGNSTAGDMTPDDQGTSHSDDLGTFLGDVDKIECSRTPSRRPTGVTV